MIRSAVFSLLISLFFSVDALLASPTVRFFNSGTCPYAQRAWIALEECRVNYETARVDLQDKPPEFVELYARANPIPGARAKVPLMEVTPPNNNKFWLCESIVIAEYIAETFGGAAAANDDTRPLLIPASAKDRATMRLFTELVTGGSCFSYFPLLRAKGDKLEAALQTFREGLVAADAFLTRFDNDKDGPFLFGASFSLAEVCAAPFVQRACTILPAFPEGAPIVNPMDICDDLGLVRLKQWMEAVLSRPSVVKTGVPKEEVMKSTARMMERFAALDTS